eukprot:Clim_evm13s217 gene=Clim_evmTU13s217
MTMQQAWALIAAVLVACSLPTSLGVQAPMDHDRIPGRKYTLDSRCLVIRESAWDLGKDGKYSEGWYRRNWNSVYAPEYSKDETGIRIGRFLHHINAENFEYMTTLYDVPFDLLVVDSDDFDIDKVPSMLEVGPKHGRYNCILKTSTRVEDFNNSSDRTPPRLMKMITNYRRKYNVKMVYMLATPLDVQGVKSIPQQRKDAEIGDPAYPAVMKALPHIKSMTKFIDVGKEFPIGESWVPLPEGTDNQGGVSYPWRVISKNICYYHAVKVTDKTRNKCFYADAEDEESCLAMVRTEEDGTETVYFFIQMAIWKTMVSTASFAWTEWMFHGIHYGARRLYLWNAIWTYEWLPGMNTYQRNQVLGDQGIGNTRYPQPYENVTEFLNLEWYPVDSPKAKIGLYDDSLHARLHRHRMRKNYLDNSKESHAQVSFFMGEDAHDPIGFEISADKDAVYPLTGLSELATRIPYAFKVKYGRQFTTWIPMERGQRFMVLAGDEEGVYYMEKTDGVTKTHRPSAEWNDPEPYPVFGAFSLTSYVMGILTMFGLQYFRKGGGFRKGYLPVSQHSRRD